jgi:hypothetical protein
MRWILLIILFNGPAAITATPAAINKCLSPDGKYYARVAYRDAYYNLDIINNKTEEILSTTKSDSIILHVEWIVDSKAIAVIKQVSGGTFLSIVFFQKGRSASRDYDISNAEDGEIESSYIYNVSKRNKEIAASYAYRILSNQTYEVKECGIESVVINILNGEIKNSSKKRISEDQYELLRASAKWTE